MSTAFSPSEILDSIDQLIDRECYRVGRAGLATLQALRAREAELSLDELIQLTLLVRLVERGLYADDLQPEPERR